MSNELKGDELHVGEVEILLAGLAAIIAIPTLIAGIYGMNFKDMPEYELPYAYPICIAAMLALDMVLYRWFKKIRWLRRTPCSNQGAQNYPAIPLTLGADWLGTVASMYRTSTGLTLRGGLGKVTRTQVPP